MNTVSVFVTMGGYRAVDVLGQQRVARGATYAAAIDHRKSLFESFSK